ncbi:sulfatase-like hydrolase/transferase, partial [Vibrio parahaemolyticus]|uniref:sulfatase-like hydrolase/transferase n=1 Tax=Vibrio parahaemolyticus TaxID=670 RepID=UPI00146B8CD2
ITNDFLQFVQQPNSQPYFGFLFYDSAHGTEFPEPEGAQFTPYWERVDHILLNNDFDAELYHNRYKNSLYYIDGLIDKVLKNIDLSNTIVVLTSDHGEEFNDNGMNYWGHSGNYSQA